MERELALPVEDVAGEGPVDEVLALPDRDAGEELKRRVDQIEGVAYRVMDGSGL